MEDTDVCPVCGSHEVRQEEDVLDTWFSSQLWTFATQGWPDHPDELVGHHPTKVLVTARDIIALWVARMIMSSLYFIGEIPFDDVFIYATILAKDGSRMSKSKGNGVDPMEMCIRDRRRRRRRPGRRAGLPCPSTFDAICRLVLKSCHHCTG